MVENLEIFWGPIFFTLKKRGVQNHVQKGGFYDRLSSDSADDHKSQPSVVRVSPKGRGALIRKKARPRNRRLRVHVGIRVPRREVLRGTRYEPPAQETRRQG